MNTNVRNSLSADIPKHTILIVDDNPANLGVINKCLKEYGCRTAIATTGKNALERAKRIHPDLILLDIVMPDIDGFEICRHLKADEEMGDIPVIFMTALTSTENKVKGFGAGAVDYIIKPLQPEEVLARVMIHLRIRELTRSLQEHAAELTRVNAELTEANTEIQALNRQLKAENLRVSADLQESKRKYLTLAEQMSDGYFVIQDEVIVFANQAFCDMHGYRPEEVLEKEFTLFVDPENRKKVAEFYLKARHELSNSHLFEYLGRTRDARQIVIEMKTKTTYYENTPVIIGICRDITERIEMEQKVREAERMAAIGKITTSLSHEIRNPLAAVKMYLQILKKYHHFEGEDERCMDISLHEVMRLEKILSELLDFAKPLHLKFSGCHINCILAECLELFQVKFEQKQLTVIRSFDPEIPEIQADEEKLSQVFINLLLNAFEASDQKKTIRVISHYLVDADTPGIEILIEDEGPGIPEKQSQQIFQPFFSTKDKGTGIGLTNVQYFVNAHKGRVEAANRQPRGASFRVWLPA